MKTYSSKDVLKLIDQWTFLQTFGSIEYVARYGVDPSHIKLSYQTMCDDAIRFLEMATEFRGYSLKRFFEYLRKQKKEVQWMVTEERDMKRGGLEPWSDYGYSRQGVSSRGIMRDIDYKMEELQRQTEVYHRGIQASLEESKQLAQLKEQEEQSLLLLL